MSNSVSDLIKSVVGELKEVARSETVIGQPVTIGDRTVVPVVKITFGFGAGGGQGETGGTGGFGGGGGGGASIEPAAFIVMDKDGIKLLPAGHGKWDTIIDAIPGIAKKFSQFASSFRKDGAAEKEAEDWFDSVGEDEADEEK